MGYFDVHVFSRFCHIVLSPFCIAYSLGLCLLGRVFVLFVIWMSTQDLFAFVGTWWKSGEFQSFADVREEKELKDRAGSSAKGFKSRKQGEELKRGHIDSVWGVSSRYESTETGIE